MSPNPNCSSAAGIFVRRPPLPFCDRAFDMLFGRLIRGLIDLLGRSLIGARLGSELGRIEAADDIWFFVRVRPFDGPSFLGYVP